MFMSCNACLSFGKFKNQYFMYQRLFYNFILVSTGQTNAQIQELSLEAHWPWLHPARCFVALWHWFYVSIKEKRCQPFVMIFSTFFLPSYSFSTLYDCWVHLFIHFYKPYKCICLKLYLETTLKRIINKNHVTLNFISE